MFPLLAYDVLAMSEHEFSQLYKAYQSQVNLKVDFKEPEVRHINALNTYSPRELGWMGIQTKESESGLVAVIPMKGYMAPEWGYGGFNTEWAARQIEIAAENVSVTSIVLHMRTGGGTVVGSERLATVVKKASEKLPVLGFAEYMVASAGLWPYSQCTETWMDKSPISAIGSLGVMTSMLSLHEKFKADGQDWRVLRSKGSEDKALNHFSEPINEKTVAEQQWVIDTMRESFLATVRAGRPKVSASVSGRMFYGQDAMKAGFVDTRGDLEACIKRADYLARTWKK